MANRLTRSIVLALALALPGLGSAAAQGRLIEGFAISPTDQAKDAIAADSLARFPANTQSVYAIVTYKGARNQDVGVVVTAPGNIRVYDQSFKLQGDGVKAYAISGQTMYETIVADLKDLGDGARENAEKVRTQDRGQKDYAGLVAGSAGGMQSAARLLASWKLGDKAKAAAEDLGQRAEALQKVATQTVALTAADKDKYKGLAEDMLAELDTVDDAVGALDSATDEAADLTIAPTDADLGTAYAVKVEVSGSPAKSLEFWVTDKVLPTPTTTEPAPPTRSPADQATPDGKPKVTQPAAGTPGARPSAQVGTTPRATAATAVAAGATALASREPGRAATNEAILLATPVPYDTQAAILAGPTWTPVDAAAQGGAESKPGGTKAPSSNLAVFGLGILALVGLVWWLRKRM